MNDESLDTMRARLAELVTTTGTEGDVRAYLDEHFALLPENVQRELVLSLLASSVRDEAEEITAIGTMQEAGIAAAFALEALREETVREPDA